MPTEITVQNLSVQDNKLVVTPQPVSIPDATDIETTPLAEVAESTLDTILGVKDGAVRQVPVSDLIPQKTNIDIYLSGVESDTTLKYTGASVTIPANCYYAFGASIIWANSRPLEILVSGSSTSAQEYETIARSYESASVSVCGRTKSERTFYIWGRWASAANNDVSINGWYEPE